MYDLLIHEKIQELIKLSSVVHNPSARRNCLASNKLTPANQNAQNYFFTHTPPIESHYYFFVRSCTFVRSLKFARCEVVGDDLEEKVDAGTSQDTSLCWYHGNPLYLIGGSKVFLSTYDTIVPPHPR